MSEATKLLVIAYHFPPEGTVQVQRITKIVKYLPSFGIEPVVLTPAGQKIDQYDEGLLKSIPASVRIERVPFFDITKHLFAVRDRMRAWKSSAGGLKSAEGSPGRDPVAQTFARTVVQSLLFPDVGRLWVRRAVKSALKLLERDSFSAILSTSPPFSAHLIGSRLRRITGLPHIVDMRDLWRQNPYYQQATTMHKRWAARLEQEVFSTADHVIAVTPYMAQQLQSAYEFLGEAEVTTIYNGYDEEDFEGEVTRDPDTFNIRYLGSALLGSGRAIKPLLLGFREFLRLNPAAADCARLTFYGFFDKPNQDFFESFVAAEGLQNLVKAPGRVAAAEAIRSTRSADLLVLIVGHQLDSRARRLLDKVDTTSMTGKIFEYLASGNPILVLSREGLVAELVKSLSAGLCADSQDHKEIAEALNLSFKRWQTGELRQPGNNERIREFSRRRQTAAVASLIKALVADPRLAARRYNRLT
ncbi:MAG: glycosyltransferase [bacterium]